MRVQLKPESVSSLTEICTMRVYARMGEKKHRFRPNE
jgi:hypothetical protein